jgi:hypothetical protein
VAFRGPAPAPAEVGPAVAWAGPLAVAVVAEEEVEVVGSPAAGPGGPGPVVAAEAAPPGREPAGVEAAGEVVSPPRLG